MGNIYFNIYQHFALKFAFFLKFTAYNFCLSCHSKNERSGDSYAVSSEIFYTFISTFPTPDRYCLCTRQRP